MYRGSADSIQYFRAILLLTGFVEFGYFILHQWFLIDVDLIDVPTPEINLISVEVDMTDNCVPLGRNTDTVSSPQLSLRRR